MQILKRPMGDYQTNCYIAKTEYGDIIIDPGMGATEWVIQNATKPLAILNTHGHFDHIWSNAELQKRLKVPLYAPLGDKMLLSGSDWMPQMPPSEADIWIDGDSEFNIGGVVVKFHHFPGHCPGCSMIEIDGVVFSGDFIFEGSIGRYDFPYSNSEDMKNSLIKFSTWSDDFPLYPGHGRATSVKREQANLPFWMRHF